MSTIFNRCFVTVSDPEAALGFYRDLLGLEVRLDVPQGEYRWITVGSPEQPEVNIVLSNYLEGSASDVETLRGLMAKGGLGAAHFSSDDLDGLFERFKEAGVEILEGPTDQPWGARDGAVRDPSGNVVRIDQIR